MFVLERGRVADGAVMARWRTSQAERERERGDASEREHKLREQLGGAVAEADILRQAANARIPQVMSHPTLNSGSDLDMARKP